MQSISSFLGEVRRGLRTLRYGGAHEWAHYILGVLLVGGVFALVAAILLSEKFGSWKAAAGDLWLNLGSFVLAIFVVTALLPGVMRKFYRDNSNTE